jgi:hypothetical protein
LAGAVHSKPHFPEAQVALPPSGAEHLAPQAPQLSGEVAASTSQPLTMFLSQSRWPSVQVPVHWPSLHVVPGHGLSHEPQWLGSLARLAHVPEQQV